MNDDALPIYPLSHRARVLVAVVVVGLCVGAAWVYYRFHYGIWPGARYPAALHYCGRTYNQEHPAIQRSARNSLATEIARPAGYDGWEMYPAFEFTAPLASSYSVFAGQPKDVHVGDTPTCTVKLYLQTRPNRYLAYTLAGSVG